MDEIFAGVVGKRFKPEKMKTVIYVDIVDRIE